MITIEGWVVGNPPSVWSEVWLDAEPHSVLVLQEASQSLIFEPPSPATRVRRGRDVPVDIPIPAQYQNVRASTRPRAPQEAPYTGNLELLSADVLAFLVHDLPLDAGLIEWYTRLAIRVPWRGSSLETKLSSTAGALRLLPLYCTGRSPIIMGQSVIWAQACRAAHKRALHEVKKKAVPALTTEYQGEAALLILLSYCACASGAKSAVYTLPAPNNTAP